MQVAWIVFGLTIWGGVMAVVVLTCMDIADLIKGR